MLALSQIVTWSMALVLVVMLPRSLGPDAIGQFRIAESIWAVVGVLAGFGTHTALTLAIARDRAAGPSLIAPVIVLRVGLYLALAVVVGVIVIGRRGFDLGPVLALVGLAMLLHTIGAVATAALQGFEDLTLPARADIVFKAVNTVAVIVALLLGAGVAVVAAIAAGAAAIHTALLFRYLRRYSRLRRRAGLREASGAARRGLPYFLGAVTMVLYHQIDTLVMAVLLDDAQVGWYAAADRLVASALVVPTVVMTALFPVLARLHVDDATAAGSMLERGFRTLVLLAIPVGIGTALLSGPLTLLLFGPAFAGAGPVLGVFGVVVMIMFLTILLGQYAVAVGRERFYFGMLAVATVVTVPLDLLLVPWTNRVFDNGAIGGALAYVVTEGTILVVAVAVLAPQLVNRALGTRVLRCGLAVGAMSAAVWPVREQFPVVPVAVGAITYLGVLVLLRGFDGAERDAAVRLVRRVMSRRRDRSSS